MSKKIALITGITGQSGSYLAEILLNEGYEVHGIVRRSSLFNTQRIDHIFNPESREFLHFGDLSQGIDNLIYSIKPDIIFNAAAMSHVKVSFDVPVYTGDVNALGVARILECIHRGIKSGTLKKDIKFFQFSSSEMFGQTPTPINGYTEESQFFPVSPYGCSKLYSYYMTKLYRTGYGIFACNGIMFNKESPRRGPTFVTKKITMAAARIKLGLQDKLVLGNLNAKRDWQHSKDAMKAAYFITQQETPQDFVVASGEHRTIKEFVIHVFDYFGLDWEKYVTYDANLLRPNEVPELLGNSSKLRALGWKPEYNFKMLVKEMCDYDFEMAKKELNNVGTTTNTF